MNKLNLLTIGVMPGFVTMMLLDVLLTNVSQMI